MTHPNRLWVNRGRLAAEVAVAPPDPPDPPPDPGAVGMPLGTEPANVGPSANLASNVLGPKAYNSYGALQECVIINDADAVIDDLHAMLVVVNAPRVTLRRPLVQQAVITGNTLGGATTYAGWQANAARFVHGDIGHPIVLPEYLTLTELGAGADRFTFDAGAFVESCVKNSGAAIFTRCNLFGHTDICNSFTTAKLTRFVNNWAHSTTWFPNDPNRGNNTSHQDFIKATGGCHVEAIGNVVHAWPGLTNDVRQAAPYYRVPAWAADFASTDWPARLGGVNFAWTGYWNLAQVGGPVTNALLDSNVFTGPVQRYAYFLERAAPAGHVQTAITRLNRFNTPWTTAMTSYQGAGGTGAAITAGHEHYWFGNIGPTGAALLNGKAGVQAIDADYAAILNACR